MSSFFISSNIHDFTTVHFHAFSLYSNCLLRSLWTQIPVRGTFPFIIRIISTERETLAQKFPLTTRCAVCHSSFTAVPRSPGSLLMFFFSPCSSFLLVSLSSDQHFTLFPSSWHVFRVKKEASPREPREREKGVIVTSSSARKSLRRKSKVSPHPFFRSDQSRWRQASFVILAPSKSSKVDKRVGGEEAGMFDLDGQYCLTGKRIADRK